MEPDNQLRVRWDNAEHYPDLPGFPHHRHDGDEKHVLPGEPMNLFKVLDVISVAVCLPDGAPKISRRITYPEKCNP
jgi:hypothetical protein